jgi:DNA-directed RNA polymerase specialized sigma24 family protein
MNLCRDYARSKQHKQSYVTESLDAGDPHHELADRGAAANVESHERLEALERPSRNSLTIFARRCCYLLSKAFAAGVRGLLGVSTKAVEARVYRARKRLKNTLRGNNVS